MLILNNINNFNLKDTVTCGQIFRYKEEIDDSYTIVLKDRVINIKQDNNSLIIDSNIFDNLKEIVFDYFDLNRDYLSINKEIIKLDNKMINIIDKCNGLKMIKQDPFETIIEYVISMNNRVTSIKNSLDLISKKYGEKIIFRNKEYYLFPTLEKMININEDEFRSFKVGFRDKYLTNIIKCINDKSLDISKIYYMNGEEALDYLMQFKGIGPKVASCILLFSFQKFDVFPVDTWVKKLMHDEYNIDGQENINKFAKKTYKEYSGIAIQYMFHSKRNK